MYMRVCMHVYVCVCVCVFLSVCLFVFVLAWMNLREFNYVSEFTVGWQRI